MKDQLPPPIYGCSPIDPSVRDKSAVPWFNPLTWSQRKSQLEEADAMRERKKEIAPHDKRVGRPRSAEPAKVSGLKQGAMVAFASALHRAVAHAEPSVEWWVRVQGELERIPLDTLTALTAALGEILPKSE